MPTPATPYQPLTSMAELDAVIASSHQQPVFIFKHSMTCGVSAVADEEVRRFLGTGEAVVCGRVVVQSARPVSAAIAQRFGLRHESPQVLLVRDGQLVWNASHWKVTADALAGAVRAAAPAGV